MALTEIEKAINRLNKYGWTRRAYGSMEAGYCIRGSLREHTRHNRKEISRSLELIEKSIINLYPTHASLIIGCKTNIASFNDHPSTTFEDVMLVMKHAAEEERNEV